VASSRRSSTDLALIAGFGALVAASAVLPAIPVGQLGVPITLQTFAVLLAGAVLGSVRGFLSVALYVVVGLAGAPIFAGGNAGLGVLAGPSAGYLLAFAPAAFVCGFLVERLPRHKVATSVPLIALAGLVGLVVNHLGGLLGLVLRLDLTWPEAVVADLPFVPGDLVKVVAVAFVATAVHRAFPDLLGRPARAPEGAPATHSPA
jgi:biotin transport system substrate-specific component